ncbi:hypothetical protein GCM10023226_30380 [Nocardioides nanhaiensis]|uniref:Uncharacterized protein n=1 Tax=Nocardioides nanhaiensis TaxID=1476871 RepID=A0ABP8WK56_9ACTN
MRARRWLASRSFCDNLYEDDISVERGLLLNLLEAARRAGADADRIDILLA